MHRPLLFLDVDGTLLPVGGSPSATAADWDDHTGPALPHRVDARYGLTEDDVDAADAWLRAAVVRR